MKHRIRSENARDAARLGELIKKSREKLQMSQEELASHIDLTDAQVSRLERGLNSTDAERLVKVARLLALDPARLMRLSGYDELAEALQANREGSAWTQRREQLAISERDIDAVDRVLSRLKRVNADRTR